MNPAHTPLVYIVDDEPALHDALLELLKSVGLQALAVADIEAIITAYQPERPGCLLLGIQHPGPDDLNAQQRLREQGIDLPVIIIAGHSDVSLAVNAMKQGVLDFIEKPFNDQLLLDGVHHAVAEDTIRRRSRARRREFQHRFDTLTPREQDVLRRVAEGLSNRDIAEVLHLSRKTVEVHRAKVMDKMRADTLAQLLRMTMALGILKLYDFDA
ncbi:MAG: response regulator transcription factor [Candidatus Competibacter sp.]|nr:response regulator transcription factor [Candidatus Competibacter sp.]MDG4604465.1 LuxR C-terminal-related transcriptional regulator [Candidatus Contendobacter sp.]HRD50665.1 LuxR C-terminal-related transcriptional regulator [Candidatus Contendobacter sp.]